MNFKANDNITEKGILKVQRKCNEEQHFQQRVYSIHAEILTLICFSCKEINTTAILR